MVTGFCVKFNYDRLRIDEALGNYRNLITTTTLLALWRAVSCPKTGDRKLATIYATGFRRVCHGR